MTDAATLEAIRRVEETPLNELVNVSIEDVQAQMDALLSPDNDSASFYHRWETQQWAVSDLDFEQDKRDWGNIPPPVDCAVKTVIDGDALSFSIAAASVIAKETRDRYMRRADAAHPGWDFAQHVGYVLSQALSHELVPERLYMRRIAERCDCLADGKGTHARTKLWIVNLTCL